MSSEDQPYLLINLIDHEDRRRESKHSAIDMQTSIDDFTLHDYPLRSNYPLQYLSTEVHACAAAQLPALLYLRLLVASLCVLAVANVMCKRGGQCTWEVTRHRQKHAQT